MAPRPSSASIGYFPSCVVLTSGKVSMPYRIRHSAQLDDERRRRSGLVEHRERQVEGNAPVWLVDDLADAQVAGQAAQDVRVLAAQLLLFGQPPDRVADRV